MEYMWCHKLLPRQFVTHETSNILQKKKERKKIMIPPHDAARDIWHKANIQNFYSCRASLMILLGSKCHYSLLCVRAVVSDCCLQMTDC